ncbi:MAG: phosphoadenylyl-sulfate reductase [Tenuifilaceae bacterium]
MSKQNIVAELSNKLSEKSFNEILAWFLNEYKGRIALSSSLGAEDQVLTDMIMKIAPDTKIFTLDTGRLFCETYELIEKTSLRYKFKMEIFFPDSEKVQLMVAQKGINLFYQSVENRKECCHIRKIEPLKRAFKGLDVWICGLRKDQSTTRTQNQMIEWDEANGLIKLNPLIDWTEKQVWDYIKQNNVPYNTLHDKGYPSIGCQPCTREVFPSEDVRAGRWWWENADSKECGLHNRKK